MTTIYLYKCCSEFVPTSSWGGGFLRFTRHHFFNKRKIGHGQHLMSEAFKKRNANFCYEFYVREETKRKKARINFFLFIPLISEENPILILKYKSDINYNLTTKITTKIITSNAHRHKKVIVGINR